MAKKTGVRKDQKKRSVGTSRTGKTNQYQPREWEVDRIEKARRGWTRKQEMDEGIISVLLKPASH